MSPSLPLWTWLVSISRPLSLRGGQRCRQRPSEKTLVLSGHKAFCSVFGLHNKIFRLGLLSYSFVLIFADDGLFLFVSFLVFLSPLNDTDTDKLNLITVKSGNFRNSEAPSYS